MFDCAFKAVSRQAQHPLPGAPENDGRRAAVHQRRDFQDRQHAQRMHRRGNPRHLRSGLEDGPQMRGHLSRRLETFAAAQHQRRPTKAATKPIAAPESSALEARIKELEAEVAKLRAESGKPLRRRLTDTRTAVTHKFDIAGHEGYLTVGLFEDGQPGELFITMAKEGSTIGGLMDSIGTLTSMALQYGVPLEALVRKFAHQRFEPTGFTKNPEIRNASSITDYVFRWLALQFIPGYRETEINELPCQNSVQSSKSSSSTGARWARAGASTAPWRKCTRCSSSRPSRSTPTTSSTRSSVARSNVSTSLKELQGWGIVKLVHVLGDKRDHFESMKDVWEMFRVVLDERKKREIDPTMRMLHECIAEAEKDKETDEYTEQKLRELAEFFETTTAWYGQVRQWPTSALTRFVKQAGKITKKINYNFMVSFDYSGLDEAFLVAGIVFWSLVAAFVLLVVGWLSQRLRKKWLLSARIWLRCSLGISTVFFVVFSLPSLLICSGVMSVLMCICSAGPWIWLSLAGAALLCCVAAPDPRQPRNFWRHVSVTTEITGKDAGRGWVFYDAECRFCVAGMKRWGGLFARRGFQ